MYCINTIDYIIIFNLKQPFTRAQYDALPDPSDLYKSTLNPTTNSRIMFSLMYVSRGIITHGNLCLNEEKE